MKHQRINTEMIAKGVRLILEGLGEDPQREGLLKTPERVAEMYAELTAGLDEDPDAQLSALPGEHYAGLIAVRDIEFYSMCEHHLAPFKGKCHIAYLPQGGRVTGVSKLARVTEIYARRLQVQERLAAEIATALERGLKPRGVLVMIEAEHTCMTMRGVKKTGAQMVTVVGLGELSEGAEGRKEAIELIKA
jgi:GTP cyclohydrolase I